MSPEEKAMNEAFEKAMQGINAFNKEARSAIDCGKEILGKK